MSRRTETAYKAKSGSEFAFMPLGATKRSSDFTGYGKCCWCNAQDVLVPGRRQDGAYFARRWRKFTFLSGPAALACPRRGGDLFDMQPDKATLRVATLPVIKEESAEAIVALSERRAEHESGKNLYEFS